MAVGADPDQIAILDNFSWGNTNLPDRMGSLVRCAQGCYDAAVAYDVPFISGKDSLNNEYLGADGQRHAIPGTLVISAVGIVPDVTKTVTMDFKEPGNLIYVVGETRNEMGGSHYNLLHGIEGGTIPQPNPDAMKTYRALHQAIQMGLVQSCHDVSEGGLGVAMAEMCIAGGLGIAMDDYDFSGVTDETDAHRQRRILFSESIGRLIVEVRPEHDLAFQEFLGGKFAWDRLATVTNSSQMCLAAFGRSNAEYHIAESEMVKAWCGHMIDETNGTPQSGAQHPAPLQTTTIDRVPSVRSGPPKVLILHANGTNRDRDAVLACELAGGEPEIVHVNQLFSAERDLLDYHMLVVPGGFSYGDDLGAGVLWALDLRERLTDIDRFIADGRPVLGICNGFQTLVKAGLIPGSGWNGNAKRPVTLTYNERDRFECRWVSLEPNSASPCLFTEELAEPIYCPVAHGEGRVAVRDEATREQLWRDGLVALTYVDAAGQAIGYPVNPNGSVDNIAGLCNPAGNVFGLMPHPENHLFPWQHPRREVAMDGLRLFRNGIKYV